MRRLTGLGVLTVLALLLVACGGDSGDDEPTATSEPTTEMVATIAEPTTPAATVPSTPVASPAAATPVGTGSTPVATPAQPVATPSIATPVASPAISPAATPAVVAEVPGTDGDAGTQTLTGTVLLPGTANERFVISNDGCIGLGDYAGLQAGQQVIVRNENGTVIGTANLAATGSAVVCSWTFEIEVPVSEYYEVSIPMRAEQVYAASDVTASNGQIELTLP